MNRKNAPAIRFPSCPQKKMLVITIALPPFLCQWLKSRMGDPARFPNGSYENALIARHLSKRPSQKAQSSQSFLSIKSFQSKESKKSNEANEASLARIAAPSVRGKPPGSWNYLPRRGRDELRAAIVTLFTLDLWNSCVSLLANRTVSLGEGLDEWCRSRSITPENREAVRQRFYRLRRAYAARGVILGRRYRKG